MRRCPVTHEGFVCHASQGHEGSHMHTDGLRWDTPSKPVCHGLKWLEADGSRDSSDLSEPHRPASDALVLQMFRECGLPVTMLGLGGVVIRDDDGCALAAVGIPDDDHRARSSLTLLRDWVDHVGAPVLAQRLAHNAPCATCAGAWPMLCPQCGPENCK